jgi:hypothetical protein
MLPVGRVVEGLQTHRYQVCRSVRSCPCKFTGAKATGMSTNPRIKLRWARHLDTQRKPFEGGGGRRSSQWTQAAVATWCCKAVCVAILFPKCRPTLPKTWVSGQWSCPGTIPCWHPLYFSPMRRVGDAYAGNLQQNDTAFVYHSPRCTLSCTWRASEVGFR